MPCAKAADEQAKNVSGQISDREKNLFYNAIGVFLAEKRCFSERVYILLTRQR
jgi:hypothetical protein